MAMSWLSHGESIEYQPFVRLPRHRSDSETYACHDMKNAGPSYTNAYSRFAREISIGCCSIHSGLLIPKADESYPSIQPFLANVRDWQSGETKDCLYSEIVEGLSDNGSSIHGRRL